MDMIKSEVEKRILLDAKALQAAGIPRAIVYQLLNRKDMPVVTFGRRKFMLRDAFMRWLEENAEQLEA